MSWLEVPTGLLPVVLLLVALVALDGYKLVPRGRVALSIAFGAAAALAAWGLNAGAMSLASLPPDLVKRWVAPVVEEALKLSWIVVLVRRGRIGFLVDAAIHGFAVGAGFALVENLYYAATLDHPGFLLWIVRGLGTAVMHGTATGVAAVISRDLTERRRSNAIAGFVPGFAVAVLVHAVFNQLPFPPLVETVCIALGAPLVLVAAYEISERQTRRWLGASLDRDVELIEQIQSGTIADTPTGHYLTSLRERFAGPVVGDMLCLLEVHTRLAMRAKGVLLAREAGVDLPPDPEVKKDLDELGYLRRAIGVTGMMAVMPILGASDRDLWQLLVFDGDRRERGAPPTATRGAP